MKKGGPEPGICHLEPGICPEFATRSPEFATRNGGKSAVRTHPTTRAGGQDYGSFNKLPQIIYSYT